MRDFDELRVTKDKKKSVRMCSVFIVASDVDFAAVIQAATMCTVLCDKHLRAS